MSNDEIRIDWKAVWETLKGKKKLFALTFVITVSVTYLIALSIPKTYSVKVKLAPEISAITGRNYSSNTLSSLMRQFNSMTSVSNTSDAILPALYPELINSQTFIVSLFDIPVVSKDGQIQTTYYDYISRFQKSPWWTKPVSWIFGLFGKKADDSLQDSAFDAGSLTVEQYNISKVISHKVFCDIDEKVGTLTISVSDQDPLICATIADSTCMRLQQFITDYRTKKAYQELQNIQIQYDQALLSYNESKEKVQSFNSNHWDLVDDDLKIERTSLTNEMQLAFSTLTAFNTQLVEARSKYEGLRPVFTVLDGASVPLRPSAPSKKKIVLGTLVFVYLIELIVVLRSYIKSTFRQIRDTAQ